MKSIKLHFLFLLISMALFIIHEGKTDTPETGVLFINEFLASNQNNKVDPDYGQYVDWIEIFNSGSENIDMEGWYLTDDINDPFKWQIPDNTIIQSHDHLLIWADGMDESATAQHSNFKLSAQGEIIGLYNPEGALIDALEYGQQHSDISYGRQPDGNSTWYFFANPTPGESNTSSGVLNATLSPDPVFSIQSGFYDGNQNLFLSVSDQEAHIYYTLDGSIPTDTSIPYSVPISLASTTIVRSRTIQPGLLPSRIGSNTYFINESFSLPVISLITDPMNLWDDDTGIYLDENVEERKEWSRPALLEFYNGSKIPDFVVESEIRLFGRSAIHLPQKSLAVFPNETLHYPLFKDREDDTYNSFILRSSSDDWHLTLFRDAFMHELMKDYFIIDRQAYQPSILFINGSYWGIHNIREKYNESYLEKYHGINPSDIDLLYVDYRAETVDILAGDDLHFNILLDYIQQNNLDEEEHYNYVSTLMDMDNFIDYMVAQTYFANWSWAHNIRMWRPRTEGGKWQWLIFDLDRGFKEYDQDIIFDMNNRFPIFHALMENESFRIKFVQKHDAHFNASFIKERMLHVMDSIKTLIEPEMPGHVERWKNESNNDTQGIQSMADWYTHINAMIDFADLRYNIQRYYLTDAFDLSGTSQLSLNINEPGGGRIRISNTFFAQDGFSGPFFKDIPITITARANPGYRFIRWGDDSETAVTLIGYGTEWKYLDDGSDRDTAWKEQGYNDTEWKSGPAELGYGDGDEATEIGFGSDVNNKYITTYFRHTFTIENPDSYHGYTIQLLRDDGAIVYLNGREIIRSNMPPGNIDYLTLAGTSVDADEDLYIPYIIDPGLFVIGANVLAAEIHQGDPASSDISFNLQLNTIGFNTGSPYYTSDSTLTVYLYGDTELTARFDIITNHQLPADITEDIVLTQENSPYIASGDIRIHPDASLIAHPGVEIHMPKSSNVIVNGQLQWIGTESQPVVIKSAIPSLRWGALCFENTTCTSDLVYVRLEQASTGNDPITHRGAVSLNYADLNLNHVTIINVLQPVYGSHANIIMQNCVIDGSNTGDDIINIRHANAMIENCDISGKGELDFDFVDNGIIRNNRFTISTTDPNIDGIDIGESKDVLIDGNWIINSPDKGISIGEHSTASVKRNIIINSNQGIAVKDSSFAVIDHNTLFANNQSIACYEKTAGYGGAGATVTNTIISSSSSADSYLDTQSWMDITYSLSDTEILPGTGNIWADPHFENAENLDFNLISDSPCIDTGDPNSPLDPDSTRTDIGALYFDNTPPEAIPLFINEFLARNHTSVQDDQGDYDDWIELYNAGNLAIDIGGYYITDELASPKKYQIPVTNTTQTTIAPGGFLVLWADGDTNQSVLHLGFKLSASGEQIALYHPANTTMIDSVSFGPQSDDISYGRYPDGAIHWTSFSQPTPGSANTMDLPSIHLVSPPNDTTIQILSDADTVLHFFWTSWSHTNISDSLEGYHFFLKDPESNSLKDTSVTDTLLSLSIPSSVPLQTQWYVLAEQWNGTTIFSDTFDLYFEHVTGVSTINSIPAHFALYHNFPNPFNAETTIQYALPQDAFVRLIIFNIIGQEIETVIHTNQKAGYHICHWNATSTSSGLYFYVLQVMDIHKNDKIIFQQLNKMLLLK